ARSRSGKSAGARIAAPGASGARSPADGDHQRAAPRANHAGDRRDRSADEGDERADRVVIGSVNGNQSGDASSTASAVDAVHRYHDGTKHHFTRFARSLGYLDWASQPNPFRAFPGARTTSLIRHPAPIASVLRHALGLSAWKQFRGSRWSLRANPSSGNL